VVVLAELVGTGVDLDAGEHVEHQLAYIAADNDSLRAGDIA
jgi:hypothetical protein